MLVTLTPETVTRPFAGQEATAMPEVMNSTSVPVERAALAGRVRAAVADVVQKQIAAGIDLVNDGEMSKPSYATYIKDRLDGFGGTGNTFVYQDLAAFPKLASRVFGDPGRSRRARPKRRSEPAGGSEVLPQSGEGGRIVERAGGGPAKRGAFRESGA